MPDGEEIDVGLRGSVRGIATVVVAAGGYMLLLFAVAWLTAWVLRVV